MCSCWAGKCGRGGGGGVIGGEIDDFHVLFLDFVGEKRPQRRRLQD